MLQWDIKMTKNMDTLLRDVRVEFKKEIMTEKAMWESSIQDKDVWQGKEFREEKFRIRKQKQSMEQVKKQQQ